MHSDPGSGRERLAQLKGQRVKGSCEWILTNELYRKWLSSDSGNQILAITGNPGSGKTMLSLFITEDLQGPPWQTEQTQLLYYFCDFRDERPNTALAILRGLICQLTSKHPRLLDTIWPHLDTPEKAWYKATSLDALWTMFTNLLEDSKIGTIFCVIDGIDEYENDSMTALGLKFDDLFSAGPTGPILGNFRLLITARSVRSLRNVPTIRIDSDAKQTVRTEVKRFINSQVKELSARRQTNHIVRDRIRGKVQECAKGNFLSAYLILHRLSRFSTTPEIIEGLEHFSRGLDTIYRRILLGIKPEYRDICSLILRWVVMAHRTLSLQELAAAIQLQSRVPIENSQAIISYITMCIPLLSVYQGDLVLVHESARNYLTWQDLGKDEALKAFYIQTEEANAELAQTCFECIQSSTLQFSQISVTNKLLLSKDPLIGYAVMYWLEHAKRSPKYADKVFDPSHSFFQEKSDLRRNWWQSYWKVGDSVWGELDIPLLHISAYCGILPWVEKLIAQPRKPFSIHRHAEKEDPYGRQPLYYAASAGHAEIIPVLVANGADVNAADNSGRTALIEASAGGHENCVRVLLSHGANSWGADKGGRTALASAAFGGYINIIQRLLDDGVDPNGPGKGILGLSVLEEAVSAGHVELARFLVDRGADVNESAIKLLGRPTLVKRLFRTPADDKSAPP
ncbi:hypothetical protein AJ79_00610 [Helicocarpus griseus UAMH5409]|uniref:NACHT domain-containing protein n=1 Tax=Helicocarpus griseus UAMH5409 TaxID=1447875 RepID=A0A2B7YB37_9EURO|nr:hypothetical protein AJ79_00610 [Helicocarpus griseus UAMH5409]